MSTENVVSVRMKEDRKPIFSNVPVSPEEMERVVRGALGTVVVSRPIPQDGEPSSIPVRPPRPRNLARQILEGDALKADAKRFLSRRRDSVPYFWSVDGILDAEQALAAVGIPGGTFLGLLRFSADFQDDRQMGRTAAERRWWGLLRRRLASSSGIALVRSVADGMELVRHMVEDADVTTQQGFTDLLRLLGARTGLDVIGQPRLAEKALWEFAVLLASRTRTWNRSHPQEPRRIVPLDFLTGGTMVYMADRQCEPSLAELRAAVFQTGAPLAPALDAWLRRLQEIPGSSLLRIPMALEHDPRIWVWTVGQQLSSDARPARLARIAACERALLDQARREEATREAAAVAIERSIRQILERELPASRLSPAPAAPEPAKAAAEVPPPPPEPPPSLASVAPTFLDGGFDPATRGADPVVAASTATLPPRPPAAPPPPRLVRGRSAPTADPAPVTARVEPAALTDSSSLALAMQEYETSANLRTITLPIQGLDVVDLVPGGLDALPVGFDLGDLERQATLLEECMRTGYTPQGRQWVERYRGLLADARVREFLRFPAEWIGGLRDLLTSGDPWILAGFEDLVRYLYPARSRPQELEFRYNQRLGDPGPLRTGWDWVVLRLLALAVAETASGQGDPEFAPTPMITVRRWHALSRARDLEPHTPAWWSWLAEEVDARTEAVFRKPFLVRSGPELSLWRERHVKPWLAIPGEANIASLGSWARMPLHALRQDESPSAERWANRLSMLGQFLEESKEEVLEEIVEAPL